METTTTTKNTRFNLNNKIKEGKETTESFNDGTYTFLRKTLKFTHKNENYKDVRYELYLNPNSSFTISSDEKEFTNFLNGEYSETMKKRITKNDF